MRRLIVRRTRLKLAVAMLSGVFALGSGAALGGVAKKPPPPPPRKKSPPAKPVCGPPVHKRHPCQLPRW